MNKNLVFYRDIPIFNRYDPLRRATLLLPAGTPHPFLITRDNLYELIPHPAVYRHETPRIEDGIEVMVNQWFIVPIGNCPCTTCETMGCEDCEGLGYYPNPTIPKSYFEWEAQS